MDSHAEVFKLRLAHVALVSDGKNLERSRFDGDSAEFRERRRGIPDLSIEGIARTGAG